MSNLSAGQGSQNVILTKWRHTLLLPASDVNKEPFRVNKRGRYFAQLLLSQSLVAGRGVCLAVYHALDQLVIFIKCRHLWYEFHSCTLEFSLSLSLPKGTISFYDNNLHSPVILKAFYVVSSKNTCLWNFKLQLVCFFSAIGFILFEALRKDNYIFFCKLCTIVIYTTTYVKYINLLNM